MDQLHGCLAKIDGLGSAIEDGADQFISKPNGCRAAIRKQGPTLYRKEPASVVQVDRDISKERGWASVGM